MRKKINKNPKRINKKAIIAVVAVVAIIGGIAAFSAFEAHIINVTAKIENALLVDTTPIDFGTVFPQEYLEKLLTVVLSNSFINEDRVDDVEYIIKQKPKPKHPENPVPQGFDTWHDYCAAVLLDLDNCYPLLCPYLSKHPDGVDDSGLLVSNDTGLPSFHSPQEIAYGRLAKSENDTIDNWILDLDVPCFDGMCAQDWTHQGYELPTILEHEVFGCDLWIEVTGISRVGEENGDEKGLACTASGGTVATSTCCLSAGDFPDNCSTGACGCAPQDSHEVKVCDCGPDRCFDGNTCVDVCKPTTEICDDGVDNDCDGFKDCADFDCSAFPACNPECTTGNTKPCYTGDIGTQGVGLCHSGTETCVASFWNGVCVGDVTPVVEVCDGLDNDCDGVADEGNPEGGGSCDTGLFGICAAGTYQCQLGSLQCIQDLSPQVEVCNDIDDDCDGIVDNEACQNNDWTYEQNFNTLTDGNLNGQDGWLRVSGNNISVQTSTKYEGAKAISGISKPSPDPTDYRRSITAINEGTVYVAMSVSTIPSGDGVYFVLREGTTGRMNIGFANDGNIKIYDNSSGYQTITSFNANQWYVIAVQFDDTNYANQYRAKVHNGSSWGSWTSWYTVNGGSYTNIDGIRLANFGPLGSCTTYWDTITPNDPS